MAKTIEEKWAEAWKEYQENSEKMLAQHRHEMEMMNEASLLASEMHLMRMREIHAKAKARLG